MNFGEIYSQVSSLVNGTPNKVNVRNWVNDVLNRVGKDVPIWDTTTLTLTDGTRVISLPSDFIKLDRLVDSNDVDYTSFVIRYVGNARSLVLDEATEEDEDLTLDYYRVPATITSDSGIPEIPAEWHWILVRYCIYMYKFRQEDAEDAETSLAFKEFQDGWREMVEAINSEGGSFTCDEVW